MSGKDTSMEGEDFQGRAERAERLVVQLYRALREVVEAADDHTPNGGWNRLHPALREQREALRAVEQSTSEAR